MDSNVTGNFGDCIVVLAACSGGIRPPARPHNDTALSLLRRETSPGPPPSRDSGLIGLARCHKPSAMLPSS